MKAGLPPALQITPLFDQSIFVSESISEVVREATIAAGLTALMILLFLGSWRSTLIVCTSIPVSIATSLVILYALQQTINVMTLGGLALAVGILVDDATVEIENTHRNMSARKPLVRAILDSAQQVASPAFVSTHRLMPRAMKFSCGRHRDAACNWRIRSGSRLKMPPLLWKTHTRHMRRRSRAGISRNSCCRRKRISFRSGSTNYLIVQDGAYLAQARSTEVAARSDWMKALITLDRSLGNLFEKNQIVVDDAIRGTLP